MTVKEYVDTILCVPVTRVGNIFIVEAIEIVLDTHEHKFYSKLANIHKTTPQYLEKAMREAKNRGLLSMDRFLRHMIFKDVYVATGEYVVRAAEYYRRKYEDKE